MAGVVSQPGVVLDQVLPIPTFIHLFLLALVFVWWVSPRNLIVLLPAVPTVTMNVLGVDPQQRTLGYQYSVPVLPFLLLAVARSLSSSDRTLAQVLVHSITDGGATRWKDSPWRPRLMIVWATLMLAWLGRWEPTAQQLSRRGTLDAVREWVVQVPAEASVLTDNRLAPQLTHRAEVHLVAEQWPWSPPEVDYVLLDLTEPWPDSREVAERVVEALADDARYELLNRSEGVHVFRRR
jgi:uncharacterized membrane protein